MLRRKSYKNEDYVEDNIPPTELPYMRVRRQALAELVFQYPGLLKAVTEIAEEQAAKFFVPLPVQTSEQKIQYADYKMISDVLEMLFVQVHDEARQGLAELQDDHERAYTPVAQGIGGYQGSQQYGNEGREQWTTI